MKSRHVDVVDREICYFSRLPTSSEAPVMALDIFSTPRHTKEA